MKDIVNIPIKSGVRAIREIVLFSIVTMNNLHNTRIHPRIISKSFNKCGIWLNVKGDPYLMATLGAEEIIATPIYGENNYIGRQMVTGWNRRRTAP